MIRVKFSEHWEKKKKNKAGSQEKEWGYSVNLLCILVTDNIDLCSFVNR